MDRDPDLELFSDEDLRELVANAQRALRVILQAVDTLPISEWPATRLLHIEDLRSKIHRYGRELSRRPDTSQSPSTSLLDGGDETQRERTDIFLSHASEDEQLAQPLYDALIARGSRVFFAPRSVRYADSFVRRINDALDDARLGVVLWSDAAASSSWVSNEINSLVVRKNHGECVILVIRLEPLAPPVPALLQDLHRIDSGPGSNIEQLATAILASLDAWTPS